VIISDVARVVLTIKAAHEFGINSLDVAGIQNDRLLIVSGGDD
jgi:hypothetical protein